MSARPESDPFPPATALTATTATDAQTEAIAEQLAPLLQPGDLICLFGDLGAGKTTFVRGLVRGLNLPDAVSSPTFSLVHEYGRGTRLPVFHVDAYRLRGADDLTDIGGDDYLADRRAILVVEWPERILDGLPDERLEIHFTETLENKRLLRFWPRGARWQDFARGGENQAACAF